MPASTPQIIYHHTIKQHTYEMSCTVTKTYTALLIYKLSMGE